MFGLVIRLLGKTPGVVRVVTVFLQFPFRVGQKLLRLVERKRCITANSPFVCVCQQAACFGQILGFDCHQLRIPVQAGRLDILAFGALQVTAFEVANCRRKFPVGFVPDLLR